MKKIKDKLDLYKDQVITRRQYEVLTGIVDGLPTNQIALRLGVREDSVRRYNKHLRALVAPDGTPLVYSVVHELGGTRLSTAAHLPFWAERIKN